MLGPPPNANGPLWSSKLNPMMHWTPAPLVADAGSRSVAALPMDLPRPRSAARGDHARMLAHAAQRRLRAKGEDRAYWMAGAPLALARATSLRAEGFAPLP